MSDIRGLQEHLQAFVSVGRYGEALGNYYAQSGDPARAQWYYEAWLQEHPDDQEIRAALESIVRSEDEPPLHAGCLQDQEEAACA